MSGDMVANVPVTYIVSLVVCPACSGVTQSITMAFQKSGKFCASQNKWLLRSGMTNDCWLNEVGETVPIFCCLDENHPAFVRTDSPRESDILIESR